MVIIARYLAKEIIAVMAAVTLILLFVFMCNKMARYLSYIAKGKYAAWVLLHIVLLQVPILLGLLMPLGLYIGILLAYGRLYADSEMTVLSACGFSPARLALLTMGYAVIVMVIVAIFSIWVQPAMTLRSEQVLSEAEAGSVIQTISSGRFQQSDSNNTERVYYVEGISRGHKHVHNVFMAQRSLAKQKDGQDSPWEILFANAGHEQLNKSTGGDYMVTTQGNLYKGTPGEKNFQAVAYKDYGIKANSAPMVSASADPETMSIGELFLAAKVERNAEAELQWRLSIPFTVLILALIALPMSRIRPRQGKFVKFLPAILIFIVYANLLFAGRGWVNSGALPVWFGMWWIHVVMLVFALWLNWRQSGWRNYRKLKVATS